MPGINEMLAALFGRVPPNATQGGVPADQGQFRPQNAPLGPLNSSAVPGRSYASPGGSGRAESAGYTTSSPGWRQDQVPTVPPPPATTGAPGPAAPRPTPRPDPVVTGATGAASAGGPTPEMIANATTTPSALFEPLNNVANATSPSSLGGMLYPGQATSPSSLGGMFPMPGPFPARPEAHPDDRTPTSVPGFLAPGQAQTPTSLGSSLPTPGGPSSARPPKVIHPDNPTTGKLAKGKDRAQTPKRPKHGGQYDLRQQGSRRAKK